MIVTYLNHNTNSNKFLMCKIHTVKKKTKIKNRESEF